MDQFAGSDCGNGDCDAPMPWDMAQIGLVEDSYCSPRCALEALDGKAAFHGRVWLHDPQFRVPRDQFPDNITKKDVDISRHAESVDAARDVVEELSDMFRGEFRVDPK